METYSPAGEVEQIAIEGSRAARAALRERFPSNEVVADQTVDVCCIIHKALIGVPSDLAVYALFVTLASLSAGRLNVDVIDTSQGGKPWKH